ncbi:MAG: 50S ribosomal protein L10 [Clostridia bacterium]|nr:50S ribosomal protein L10 [Clostridia bacterium]
MKLKEQEVAGLSEKFSKAKGIVLVDYRGMTVAEDTALRNEMRKNNVEYKVVKNRIMLRAFEKAGYTGLEDVLQGTTAVAISYDDPVTPAKVLSDNAKKINKTALKGGVIEGSVMDEKAIKSVAAIPPKTVLLSQLVGLLTSPMRSLAVGLSEVAKKQSA